MQFVPNYIINKWGCQYSNPSRLILLVELHLQKQTGKKKSTIFLKEYKEILALSVRYINIPESINK